jgi:hypothetical protein
MILTFKICNDRCIANGQMDGWGGEKSAVFRPMIDSKYPNDHWSGDISANKK